MSIFFLCLFIKGLLSDDPSHVKYFCKWFWFEVRTLRLSYILIEIIEFFNYDYRAKFDLQPNGLLIGWWLTV